MNDVQQPTNGAIPAWYRQVCDLLTTGQSEIFALTGVVDSYPVYPGEGLVDFLHRSDCGGTARQEGVDLESIAEHHVFATLSPAAGLALRDASHEAAWQRIVPPAEDNPFAGAAPAGVLGALAQIDTFLQGSNIPLSLVILDSDLVFDADSPLVEPEKTIISYIRKWAAQPLVTSEGRPHRLYLVSSSPQLRSQVMTGRVSQVAIPLPDEAERRAFINKILEGAEKDSDPLSWEEGLDDEILARQSGALDLLQIEDVMYQAYGSESRISRAQVRQRKDTLVRETYGGVLEIEYPEDGFESIVGYDDLKKYFTDWVAPKLQDGATDTPKGCLLSGPPGTGKTKFAQALAASLELPLVLVQMDRIKSKYVGESNKQMAQLIGGIKALSPAIVLFDEVDKVLGSTDDSSGVSQEIQGQLQTWMSDSPRGGTFFIATTNYPKSVGGALVRPGRLEQILPLLPSHLDRRRADVLTLVAQKLSIQVEPLEGPNFEPSPLEPCLEDYTGADLEKVIMEASYEATLDGQAVVTQDHIRRAAEYVVPTIRSAGNQKMVDDAIETCSNQRFLPAVDRPAVTQATTRRQKRQVEVGV